MAYDLNGPEYLQDLLTCRAKLIPWHDHPEERNQYLNALREDARRIMDAGCLMDVLEGAIEIVQDQYEQDCDYWQRHPEQNQSFERPTRQWLDSPHGKRYKGGIE